MGLLPTLLWKHLQVAHSGLIVRQEVDVAGQTGTVVPAGDIHHQAIYGMSLRHYLMSVSKLLLRHMQVAHSGPIVRHEVDVAGQMATAVLAVEIQHQTTSQLHLNLSEWYDCRFLFEHGVAGLLRL